MEPGRRYASGHGKVCGVLDSVGVDKIYNRCFYPQISNDKLPTQKALYLRNRRFLVCLFLIYNPFQVLLPITSSTILEYHAT